MKKGIAAIFIFLILSAFFAFSAFAAEENENDKSIVSDEIQGFLDEFEALIPSESGISIDGEGGDIGLEGMLGSLLGALRGESSAFFSFLLMLLGFAIVSVIAELTAFSGTSGDRAASAGVFVIMSLAVYPKMYSLFESVRSGLESVSSFFGAALPVMTAITTASGSVKTAGVQAMNMNIVLGVVGAIALRLLLPLSSCMLALNLVSSFGESGAPKVASSIKNAFTLGLGIITAISSATIALQTVVASASDSASLRAARYAAGGLIPVVGSSVSSALSTLAGGLAYAKSTVGAAAIGVIVVISITPLVSLLLYRLAFSICIFFLDFVGSTGSVRCFLAYRSSIDTIIAVYTMSTLVCIIQLVAFLKGGAA